jgi:hypothetical protein
MDRNTVQRKIDYLIKSYLLDFFSSGFLIKRKHVITMAGKKACSLNMSFLILDIKWDSLRHSDFQRWVVEL